MRKQSADSIKISEKHSIEQLSCTQVELQLLHRNWNATQQQFPNQCLHQHFEMQVERTPEAIALVFEEQQLTYRELNQRANQLAHYLRAQGVGPDTLVGICIERSLEMVIGLLGILKAGGAYVPLDPRYPQERLTFMLRDSQIALLLTWQGFFEWNSGADLQNVLQGVQIFCLDTQWDQLALASQENLLNLTCPANLAYMIYTSGSTGRPKGAMNTHAGIGNRLYWMQNVYHLTDADRVLQKTPFSFDVSVWEFFWPLLVGACLVVAQPEGHRDSAYLISVIASQQITTLHFVPSMLRVFLEEPGLETCASLRQVICSGEALPFDLQERFFARSQAVLLNLYGPTETAIEVTFWECQRASDLQMVPIGRPIANMQIYLLDVAGQPVPVGEVGEIYIGGVGVGRGYFRRPDLTAERFLPNPFGSQPGERLYRTGDLGRYLPDGNVEFQGRLDHQVKIRGFRIELGEIETALAQHPAVGEAAVVARENTGTGQHLVAYLVAKQSPLPSSWELRAYLHGRLPAYMVPSVFVLLEALPLTPNGKMDRKALLALHEPEQEVRRDYAAPRTFLEEAIIGIWSEVLGKKQIGIYDNFFEIGGDSLLATQVLSRIADVSQRKLSLRLFFNTPTVAGLAEQIEKSAQTASGVSTFILPAVSDGRPPALSVAQQRLWMLEQLAPGTAMYTLPLALQLIGSLHSMALEQSLNEIVRRHGALRTSFLVVDGHPVQMIVPTLHLDLQRIDLSCLSKEEQRTEISQLMSQEAEQPFDVSRGPLVRARLLQLAQQEHVLLFCMHHLVADGWSIGVLLRELIALYHAYSQRLPSPLPELSIQYADFALWQRERLVAGILEKQLAYWRKQLADAPTLLQLPTDHPRPAIQTFHGATVSFTLSPQLTQALKTLSQQQGVTLFMTLLAAFQVLLFRYTGQEDIVIGTPIAGRTHRQTEDLIGFFVNTLVLRTDLSGNPSFRSLLKRVREVALDAYAHQDVPFERLVEELQPARDLSHNPLFQILFVLQNAPLRIAELPDLKVDPLRIARKTVQFDLTLDLTETPQGLEGCFEYRTDLFEAATMQRMGAHLHMLFESMCHNPDCEIGKIAFMSTNERRQLLVEWNTTRVDYAMERCTHQLFEAQAERIPEALALIFEEKCLTYYELNHKANQLAHYLRILGVGPEVLVGICVERSIEMVVGLLAVLKAGGAYVPLDPAYPKDRLAYMLQDSQVAVLLTQKRLVAQLPAHQASLVCLDADWRRIAEQTGTNMHSEATLENAAYVIYTSGSTGKPKGVVVQHNSLLQLIFAYHEAFGVTSDDKMTQLAGLSFDATALEIWPCLTAGAELYLAEEEVRLSPTALVLWLAKRGITISFLPTALVDMIVTRPWAEGSRLRLMLTGGDQLHHAPAKEAPFALVNMYGPTENTIVATWAVIPPDQQEERLPVIGRAIANTQVYVLSQAGEPQPIGVPGELFLGGLNLARAYLNCPDLTAESFLPDPFSGRIGARLYRTGDIVRALPDGNLEFLGRRDHQVKIRGFRIELGEIESALVQHPAVQEVAIDVKKDQAGDKCLVAYLVVERLAALTSRELRRYLQERLPDYMLPSAFVLLDALPLTANGKVNRSLLPEPQFERTQQDALFVAPRDLVESALGEIWAQVLGIAQISIHDNFFEMGGHSLLATQVVSRIRDIFDVDIPVRSLFETPTIASLAPTIAQRHAWETDNEAFLQLLVELEELSEEEVRTVLAHEMPLTDKEQIS